MQKAMKFQPKERGKKWSVRGTALCLWLQRPISDSCPKSWDSVFKTNALADIAGVNPVAMAAFLNDKRELPPVAQEKLIDAFSPSTSLAKELEVISNEVRQYRNEKAGRRTLNDILGE